MVVFRSWIAASGNQDGCYDGCPMDEDLGHDVLGFFPCHRDLDYDRGNDEQD